MNWEEYHKKVSFIAPVVKSSKKTKPNLPNSTHLLPLSVQPSTHFFLYCTYVIIHITSTLSHQLTSKQIT